MLFGKSTEYLGFDDRWLILIGVPVITVITTLIIFDVEGITNPDSHCLIIGLMFTCSYWFAFRSIIIQYHKKYPGYEFHKNRLWYIFSRMAIMYFGIKFALGYVVHTIFDDPHQYMKHDSISSEISIIIIVLLAFFVYEGIYYLNKSKTIELEKRELEKITAEQRLNTLKNQVNPHFLFNSLNTLVTIIPDEPKLAIEFVQKMSKTYRNILELRDEKLITIQEELAALDSYIYLLKTRFQGKIHILNSIEKQHLNHFILPLSMQILIENAVKHNITSKTKPLKVELTSEDDHIVVRNVLQKKDQQYNSTKMGLENIKSRYSLLANKEIVVDESDGYFTVKLPIIPNTRYENTAN